MLATAGHLPCCLGLEGPAGLPYFVCAQQALLGPHWQQASAAAAAAAAAAADAVLLRPAGCPRAMQHPTHLQRHSRGLRRPALACHACSPLRIPRRYPIRCLAYRADLHEASSGGAYYLQADSSALPPSCVPSPVAPPVNQHGSSHAPHISAVLIITCCCMQLTSPPSTVTCSGLSRSMPRLIGASVIATCNHTNDCTPVPHSLGVHALYKFARYCSERTLRPAGPSALSLLMLTSSNAAAWR